ncbi:DotI/IcmL/TraM family protein [Serratia marcescens]
MQTQEQNSAEAPLAQNMAPPVSDDEARAYAHALSLQRQRELGAAFAHRCLTVMLWLCVAMVLSLSLNGYLGWQVAHPPVKYFATENGRVTPIKPMNMPAFSSEDVAAFGADALRKGFTLDFVHYRSQMTRVEPLFSDQGFEGYNKALTSSNILAAVKSQRMNLSVDVAPGVIRSKGVLGDRYTWEFQYPVTLKLDGQQTSTPAQRFIFTLRIQRTDVQEKPAGLEVTQMISTNAN